MQQVTLDSIAIRINNLERENGRLKRLSIGLIGGLAGIMLMGQAFPRNTTVEGERFILRDARGTRRAELSVKMAGPSTPGASNEIGPALDFYDSDGRRRTTLGTSFAGPYLTMFGQSSNQVGLDVVVDSPRLVLRDQQGKDRISLHVSEDRPSFFLADKDGKTRLAGAVDHTGPFITIQDRNEKARVTLLERVGISGLMVFDEKQVHRAALGLGATGVALQLADATGAVRTSFTGEADRVSASGRTWVIWAQTILPSSPGQSAKHFALPGGAWPTREECEEQRRQRLAQGTAQANNPNISFVCLPDTVDPREKR
jgi:hypothetical protein